MQIITHVMLCAALTSLQLTSPKIIDGMPILMPEKPIVGTSFISYSFYSGMPESGGPNGQPHIRVHTYLLQSDGSIHHTIYRKFTALTDEYEENGHADLSPSSRTLNLVATIFNAFINSPATTFYEHPSLHSDGARSVIYLDTPVLKKTFHGSYEALSAIEPFATLIAFLENLTSESTEK